MARIPGIDYLANRMRRALGPREALEYQYGLSEYVWSEGCPDFPRGPGYIDWFPLPTAEGYWTITLEDQGTATVVPAESGTVSCQWILTLRIRDPNGNGGVRKCLVTILE